MSAVDIALTAIGLLLAGVVKGSTGLGFSSCALPILVVTIGLQPAMALVLLPALATNLTLAFTAGHFRESLDRFAPLYLAMLPGIAIGVSLLVWVPAPLAVRMLGGVIVAYSLWALLAPRPRLSGDLQRRLQIPAGFVNGVLTGLTGSQVMPLFPYMMAVPLDAARLVQAINIAVLLSSTVLLLGLISTGVATASLILGSAGAILPAVAGTEIGRRLRCFIPDAHVRSAVLAVLLITGVGMLVR